MSNDRITIVNNDNGTVDFTINGDASWSHDIEITGIEEGFHAIQWYGDRQWGEVEYTDRNEEITDLSQFQELIDQCISKTEERRASYVPPTKERIVRDTRNTYLEDTDWIIAKYSELGGEVPQEWKDYRQALRDVTEQSGFPEDVTWPEEPSTTP